jgi:hypothetical protein
MKVWRAALLLGALVLPACEETTGPGSDGAPALLEIEYINYAWTPTYFGYFVDATGDVYSYDRQGTPWPHGEAREITEEELAEKFSLRRVLLATRDSAEIVDVVANIGQLDESQVTVEKLQCADAGLLTYRAYKYNAGNRTYQPVLLRVEGDVARQNLSPAAQELIAYLRSLELLQELLGCDP